MFTRSVLVAAIGGVVLLASVAPAMQDGASEERVLAFVAERSEKLSAFAESATKKGYTTLARRAVVHSGIAAPGSPQVEERLMALREEDDSPKLTPKTRASLEQAFTELRRDLAKKASALADSLDDVDVAGDPMYAKRWAWLAIQDDPDNAKARTLLGHVDMKKWGWVTKEDADRLAAGEVPIADGWRPKKGLARDPRPWGEQWRVASDHFVIHSNLPLDRVFAARDRVEQLRERFLADWEGTLPLVEDEARHDVYVFATKAEYESFLNANDPQHIKGVPGQYSPNFKRSMFFDVETLRAAGGQTSSLEELMLHECTHQLVHELVKVDPVPFDGNDSPNAWLNEGIAEFYGMHSVGKSGLVLDEKAIRGMLRTVQVKKSAALVKSASELTAMTKGEFQSPNGEQRVTNYASAGFLCLFLSRGATRGPWQRFVRAFFCEGNPPDSFTGAMGEQMKGLDAAFKKALGKL